MTENQAAESTTVTVIRDSETSDSQYSAFEDLARKLVNVPKEEIDAERQKG